MSSPLSLLQQCLRFLKVGSVKSLRKPAIDLCQELVCLSALALLLPEPTQAHSGPQFQRFRPLLARHVEGLIQTRLGVHHVLPALLGCVRCAVRREQEFPLEPIDLCRVGPLASLVDEGGGLGCRKF